MLRRSFLGIGLIFASFLGAGAGEAQNLNEVRIGAGVSADSAPAFVGVAQGIFAKHGLDAKLVLQQTGVELINGLVAGSTDVALLGTTPYLSGVDKGMPLVLIGHLHGDATSTAYSSAFSVVTPANSPVQSAKDFAGKKIGFPRGSSIEVYLAGLMQAAGLKLDDATLVNLKPSDVPTALRNGDVDLVSIWEPWATTAALRVEGAKRIMQGNCDTCYDPGTILTTKSAAAEKADLLQKFMDATDEAMAWIRQHPKETAAINMQWIPGVDQDVMEQALTFPVRDTRLSKNTIAGYEKFAIPALVAAGKANASLDVKASIDPRFSAKTQAEHPEYYSDLPAIPDDQKF